MVLFLYFLLHGQYISSLFLFTGIVGILLIGGPQRLTGFLQSDSFIQTASFSLSTIPLYILMAQLVMSTQIVEDLYGLAFKISKGKKGPLGVITIVIGGLLGAVSGSASATSAAMAKITFPELKNRGYNESFAGAIVAVAASLSSIIPPSVVMIIYAVAARVSIGDLFLAAVIPGILLVVIFSIILLGFLKFQNVSSDPSNESTDYMDDIPKSRYIIAIIMGTLMATAIFGGIFTGVFSPTEAGAVGAFLALLMAIIMKKFSWSYLRESLTETIKISVMTMFIIIGASLFARFASLSLVPRKIINILEPLQDNPMLIIIILMLFYFILFMIIDNIAVILMTIPIVLPIVESINADPIWFGVLVMVSCTIGLITPPVGTNVFIVGSTVNLSIEGIFKYTIIFALVSSIIVVTLLILFPELTSWLPSMKL